jgi:hypothetical protein
MAEVAGTSSETVIPRKKFKELPIYIAENHNEVFSHFYLYLQILIIQIVGYDPFRLLDIFMFWFDSGEPTWLH